MTATSRAINTESPRPLYRLPTLAQYTFLRALLDSYGASDGDAREPTRLACKAAGWCVRDAGARSGWKATDFGRTAVVDYENEEGTTDPVAKSLPGWMGEREEG